LLQRFKSPTFCIPSLMRARRSTTQLPEASAYVDAVEDLQAAVQSLAGRAPHDYMRRVNAVRRASERTRDAGEALREIDPILLARLGGPVRREDLLNTLPHAGGVAILDFFVCRDQTLGLAMTRGDAGVVVTRFVAKTFDVSHVRELLELYAEGNLRNSLAAPTPGRCSTLRKSCTTG
jgi:hypothetical protein